MADEEKRTLSDKFMLRLPDGMRDRIKLAAEVNNRSMNAEIVATLEEKYPLSDNRWIALDPYVERFRASRTPEDRAALARVLQDFLRASGSTASVQVDEDGELMIWR